MKTTTGISLETIKTIYNGPEGDLWEMIMGEQIHIGGMLSSMDLAEKARIPEGSNGVDFCCCNGAGMRYLIRYRGVSNMIGVDIAESVLDRGRERCIEEELTDRILYIQADVLDNGLPDEGFDFVWSEDAFCYVEDKKELISEAVRIIRPGGVVAFTDWVEGPVKLSEEEADRFLKFMKFPSIQNIDEYRALLEGQGCEVNVAEDTGRFSPCMDLYLDMLNKQLAYDALKIVGFDRAFMESLGGEMMFMQDLADAGKVIQGLFVAHKK